MTCLHCGAINKDTANFCKDCGMKFTTKKEQDIGTHEERLYEIAMEELESKSYVKGIWAKAFSQSDADEQRAKALYIKFRVQSLKEEFIAKRKLEEEKAKQVWIDKDTGLMWEVKTQENIEHLYSWEDGFLYAQKLNTNNYGGFSDWSVPTLEELKTLLTKEKNNDSYIKYPLSKNNNYNYWSSTTSANPTGYAWGVHFYNGDSYYNLKTYGLYVRCVRGG